MTNMAFIFTLSVAISMLLVLILALLRKVVQLGQGDCF